MGLTDSASPARRALAFCAGRVHARVRQRETNCGDVANQYRLTPLTSDEEINRFRKMNADSKLLFSFDLHWDGPRHA
ncbi:MAG: hypothetical protein LAO21_10630 [Acidobacteriia bacterium]|nr:hypothetical protein [Terriglobia bacterium]